MPPTQELIDDIYREKVLRARGMRPEQKLLSGKRQFDFSCEFVRAGIQNQHPDADEGRVEELLHERLALQRRLHNRPY